MEREGFLVGYRLLKRLPYGHEGGLMRLVSHVAGGVNAGDGLDGVIHLIDPVDPSSVYPEAQAVKRQCVIYGKPFVGSVAGAV